MSQDTMEAVMLTTDRRTVIDRRPQPVADLEEVVVRVELTGICGSDLHAASLPQVYSGGFVMGHEVSGRIEAVGPAVQNWQVGQRVAINPNGNVCGVCEWCRAGRWNFCVQATRETTVGMQRDGGLAPLLAVGPGTLRALPDSVGRIEAAWVEPAATALRAVRLAGDVKNRTVLVTGGGPIGQLAIRLLRLAGAHLVYLVEPSDERRDVGRSSGADVVLDVAGGGELIDEVDVVIEASGNADATRQGLIALRPGGTLVVVGSGEGSGLDPSLILLKEITVQGSFTYVDEFDEVLPLLADGRLRVDDLTTGVVSLRETLDAISSLRQASVMKILVDPHL